MPQQGGQRKEASLKYWLLCPASTRTTAPRRILYSTQRAKSQPRQSSELRDYLGGFDFRGDMVTRAIEPLLGVKNHVWRWPC